MPKENHQSLFDIDPNDHYQSQFQGLQTPDRRLSNRQNPHFITNSSAAFNKMNEIDQFNLVNGTSGPSQGASTNQIPYFNSQLSNTVGGTIRGTSSDELSLVRQFRMKRNLGARAASKNHPAAQTQRHNNDNKISDEFVPERERIQIMATRIPKVVIEVSEGIDQSIIEKVKQVTTKLQVQPTSFDITGILSNKGVITLVFNNYKDAVDFQQHIEREINHKTYITWVHGLYEIPETDENLYKMNDRQRLIDNNLERDDSVNR